MRPMFDGKPMTAGQALKRGRPRVRAVVAPGGFTPEFRRQVDDGWRSFWARRGRDVDSFGFRGGLGA